MPEPSPPWDFFLAHAAADTATAERLYDAIGGRARVFLDKRSMLPGDPWTRILPAVLEGTRIVVALVSPACRDAWYPASEISIALDLVRADPGRHRVIALLLDEHRPIARLQLPFGLEQTVVLSWAECGSVERVAERLLETLHAVTGQSHPPAAVLLPTDQVAAFVGETARGPSAPVAISGWDDFVRRFGAPLGAERTFLGAALRGFFDNGGERAYVVRTLAAGAARAAVAIPTADPAQQLVVDAQDAGAYGNQIVVHIEPGARIGVHLTVERDPQAAAADPLAAREEHFDNLSFDERGPNPLLQVVTSRSQRVTVRWSQPERPGAMPVAGRYRLAGGVDGSVTVSDLVGANADTGLASLAGLGDIGLVCLPDAVHPRFGPDERRWLAAELVANAERYRRFALLAFDASVDAADLPQAPSTNSYGAIYLPWVSVPGAEPGAVLRVPAVGHVAGALAQHDRQHGVHSAPRGIALHGIIAAADDRFPDPQADAATIDALARRGVNPLARDPASGRVTIEGAVTMAIEDEWQPIRVRRLFCHVSRAIEHGTAWLPFAPNDEATWAEVRQQLEAYFTTLWRAGVLLGSTPEEAFFVRCDRSTMTQDDIDNGRVVWRFGVALADSALRVPDAGAAPVRIGWEGVSTSGKCG